MRLQFYLGHPAHFHLFHNVIRKLQKKNHEIAILIKKKDVLEDLVKETGIPYINILSEGRRDSKLGMFVGMIKRDLRSKKFTKSFKPDLLIGTSVENSHLTKILGIPSININEDDASVVPFYAKFSYPWASDILSPVVCNNGKWEYKSIKYKGYHELAYLHPNHFVPDERIVSKYISDKKPYFIIRFSKLSAHHDKGIHGINKEIALHLIHILKNHGDIYISSEKKIEPEFESYRIEINPSDMHHLLAYAQIYIGDSQTMAAEAGVLGTPFIRFNDFVGRIGYLNELENKYKLGFGIRSNQVEDLYRTVSELVNTKNLDEIFMTRRNEMLKERIDVAQFLTWFIDNYPESKNIMITNPDYQDKFK